jgi:hypothetical protein
MDHLPEPGESGFEQFLNSFSCCQMDKFTSQVNERRDDSPSQSSYAPQCTHSTHHLVYTCVHTHSTSTHHTRVYPCAHTAHAQTQHTPGHTYHMHTGAHTHLMLIHSSHSTHHTHVHCVHTYHMNTSAARVHTHSTNPGICSTCIHYTSHTHSTPMHMHITHHTSHTTHIHCKPHKYTA